MIWNHCTVTTDKLNSFVLYNCLAILLESCRKADQLGKATHLYQSRWHLLPVVSEGEEETYHLQLVGPRGKDLPEGGYLHAFHDSKEDKRDSTSTFLCVHDTKKSVFSIKAFPGPTEGYPWIDPRDNAMGAQLRHCAIYSRLLNAQEVQDIYENHPKAE